MRLSVSARTRTADNNEARSLGVAIRGGYVATVYYFSQRESKVSNLEVSGGLLLVEVCLYMVVGKRVQSARAEVQVYRGCPRHEPLA